MIQGGLLTAHPGGVHGYGWSPGGGSTFRRGAGAASPGSPDLETAVAAVQRRDREKGFVLWVSSARGKYRRRGAPGGPTRQPGGPLARPRVGPRQGPFWSPGGGPLPSLDFSESFRSANFLSDFFGIFGALLMAGKPELQKQQKTATGNWVHS